MAGGKAAVFVFFAGFAAAEAMAGTSTVAFAADFTVAFTMDFAADFTGVAVFAAFFAAGFTALTGIAATRVLGAFFLAAVTCGSAAIALTPAASRVRGDFAAAVLPLPVFLEAVAMKLCNSV
ncbi:hypothetical protein [Roseateles koreensis]|uniref:Uncharacterized protein n=1 Tax=Roseateles koreensis TaxID=2987526 RepID=A0ABT5KZN0_9BURK|nr:hypothetical protein [Roseateles koreensis]MDC8787192.1 hypothetical protein [Roseateles koreensis]